jgi:hypothetical protein
MLSLLQRYPVAERPGPGMFNKPVVFVIGAGASADYGMPLGGLLATTIASDTNFWFDHSYRPTKGDADLFEILLRKFQNDRATLNSYTHAGQKLSAAVSSSVSIDDALHFLSDYPEAVALGKICIIRSILKAESLSTLRIRPETGEGLDTDAGREGWAEQMFSMAISGLKLSEIGSAFKNLTFINFNYDRCLEHYLFYSLIRLGISERDAEEIVDSVAIIRPYGTIGTVLPSDRMRVAFGARRVDAFGMIDRIRTYMQSDALHDRGHLQQIMREASMYIFLGFGFHKQNMQLLSLESEEGFRYVRTLATVKGIDRANLPDLTGAISRALKISEPSIEPFDMTAPEILAQLIPSLVDCDSLTIPKSVLF